VKELSTTLAMHLSMQIQVRAMMGLKKTLGDNLVRMVVEGPLIKHQMN